MNLHFATKIPFMNILIAHTKLLRSEMLVHVPQRGLATYTASIKLYLLFLKKKLMNTYFFTKIVKFKESRTSFNLCLDHCGWSDLRMDKTVH